jgi:hypothetical protein
VPLRLRQARLLTRPLLRAADLRPLLVAGVAALGVVALIARQDTSGPGELVTALRMAAVLLGVGVAFALDDPAAPTTAATPTPLVLRWALRAALPLPPVAVLWAVAFAIADRPGLPVPALTLELVTVLALAHVLSAATQLLTGAPAGGGAAAGLLLGLAAASLVIDPLRGPWVPYGEATWNRVHALWLLTLLGVLLVLALLSRGPGRRCRWQAPSALQSPRREAET